MTENYNGVCSRLEVGEIDGAFDTFIDRRNDSKYSYGDKHEFEREYVEYVEGWN